MCLREHPLLLYDSWIGHGEKAFSLLHFIALDVSDVLYKAFIQAMDGDKVIWRKLYSAWDHLNYPKLLR
jgi:hypothetical protein